MKNKTKKINPDLVKHNTEDIMTELYGKAGTKKRKIAEEKIAASSKTLLSRNKDKERKEKLNAKSLIKKIEAILESVIDNKGRGIAWASVEIALFINEKYKLKA